jgi:hypothetical protein
MPPPDLDLDALAGAILAWLADRLDLDVLASRLADRLAERQTAPAQRYLSIRQAATYTGEHGQPPCHAGERDADPPPARPRPRRHRPKAARRRDRREHGTAASPTRGLRSGEGAS